MLNPDAPGYDDAPWLWSDQYQHNIQILGIPQPGSRTVVQPRIARQLQIEIDADPNHDRIKVSRWPSQWITGRPLSSSSSSA